MLQMQHVLQMQQVLHMQHVFLLVPCVTDAIHDLEVLVIITRG